jgi:Tol biopolymer transport system component
MRTLVAAAIGIATADVADAQYFGQNKLRPRAFDAQVLSTEHFDIYFSASTRDTAIATGQLAERWRARIGSTLNHQLSGRQAIVLYPSHPDFRGTSVVSDSIGETTGGLTESLRRRIVMPLGATLADTDHVLGHELVHAFQFDMAASEKALGLPLWFVEGMAEYLSRPQSSDVTRMWIRDAVDRDALPSLDALDDPRLFPYRWGHAFWSFITARYGDAAVASVYRAALRTSSPAAALQETTGAEVSALAADWLAYLRVEANRANRIGAAADHDTVMSPLVRSDNGAARLQLGPVVSPDGGSVAFFTETREGSIQLVIADLATGAIRHEVTDTVLDGHIDSLQFASGSGAWDRSGRTFVFATSRAGRPELAFFDLSTNRIVRRLALPSVDEVFTIAWAPLDDRIVVSAMAQGWTDLFTVDLTSGITDRLTYDAYADLHPEVSPDGQRIAFASDRFTTDLGSLTAGAYRLATLDVRGGTPVGVAAFDRGDHVDPHWSGDGTHLYFVANQNGIANLYRVPSDGGTPTRVTDVSTGISGLSSTSPVLSIAGGQAVFTLFRNGGYQLQAANLTWLPTSTQAPSGLALSSRLTDIAADASADLPSANAFAIKPYSARLGLESVAPIAAGMGVSDFGAYIGGGTALTLGDVLGRHQVVLALQAAAFGNGGADLSGFGSYLNQRTRWNWGFRGGQSAQPARSGGTGLTFSGGEWLLVNEEISGRIVDRDIAGILVRPLSRARRLEFSAGVQSVGLSASRTLDTYSATTGAFLGSTTTELPSRGQVFTMATAAFVHDSSLAGATGPVAGVRYRVEGGVSGGSARFASVLADGRRYFRIAEPFTVAVRGLHFGRYGMSGDSVPADVSLGYPSLLRGYEPGSFGASDCDQATGRCDAIGRLFGSRIAVTNVEWRTALTGPRGLLRGAGILPVEAAAFVDAGTAWARQTTAPVNSRLLTSVGASLRVNLLGFGIGQVSYVRPNNRPDTSWRWEFSLTPAF